MSVYNSHPPKIEIDNFKLWLRNNYEIFRNNKFNLSPLVSERDKNYLCTVNKTKKYVIKIHNPLENSSFLKFQDYVLKKLLRTKTKKYVPIIIHTKINEYLDKDKRKCLVRILSYIEGEMYVHIKKNESLEKSLGNFLGILTCSLQNIIHKSSVRKFPWDPSNIDWLKKEFVVIKNKEQREHVSKICIEYNKFIKNNKKNIKYSLTHGDAHHYNLVVKNNKIFGLIDYGDMVYAPTINDLAICLAYALMNNNDIISTLRNILIAYSKIYRINKSEIFLLMTLVKCRLAISVVMSAKQKQKFPNNKYLLISEKPAWNLIKKLNNINPFFFIFYIKNFLNYEIIDQYSNLVKFLRNYHFDEIFE